MRVLYVEDEKLLADAVTYLLEKAGFIVDLASDGATISASELPHIFERFYQTDKTASGVGLGLAIAKTIADRNNWQLTATSSETTTFQLTF